MFAFFFWFSGSGSQHTYFMCVFLFNFERTMTPPELIRFGGRVRNWNSIIAP